MPPSFFAIIKCMTSHLLFRRLAIAIFLISFASFAYAAPPSSPPSPSSPPPPDPRSAGPLPPASPYPGPPPADFQISRPLLERLAVIERFLADSQSFVNFLDPEIRTLYRLPSPDFDFNIISRELFDALKVAGPETLRMVGDLPPIRATQSIDVARIDGGNTRWLTPPFDLPELVRDTPRIIDIPSDGSAAKSKPLFNIPPPPFDRNAYFHELVSGKAPRIIDISSDESAAKSESFFDKSLRQKIPRTVFNQIDATKDSIKFAQELQSAVRHAQVRAEGILRVLLNEGMATPPQIDIAHDLGLPLEQERLLRANWDVIQRENLLRRSPSADSTASTEPVRSTPPLRPSHPQAFSQAASPPNPLNVGEPRRTLWRYFNNPYPARTIQNPMQDPFHTAGVGYGTRFLYPPEPGTLFPSEEMIANRLRPPTLSISRPSAQTPTVPSAPRASFMVPAATMVNRVGIIGMFSGLFGPISEFLSLLDEPRSSAEISRQMRSLQVRLDALREERGTRAFFIRTSELEYVEARMRKLLEDYDKARQMEAAHQQPI